MAPRQSLRPKTGSRTLGLDSSDSDHGGMIKASCTKSQTGVIILLNSMPVFWKSNKQPVTALSSAEAEVYAMMEAVKEARLRLWVAEEAGVCTGELSTNPNGG